MRAAALESGSLDGGPRMLGALWQVLDTSCVPLLKTAQQTFVYQNIRFPISTRIALFPSEPPNHHPELKTARKPQLPNLSAGPIFLQNPRSVCT